MRNAGLGIAIKINGTNAKHARGLAYFLLTSSGLEAKVPKKRFDMALFIQVNSTYLSYCHEMDYSAIYTIITIQAGEAPTYWCIHNRAGELRRELPMRLQLLVRIA